jgi:hypothetical protein
MAGLPMSSQTQPVPHAPPTEYSDSSVMLSPPVPEASAQSKPKPLGVMAWKLSV